jgi:hypothetical protein
VQVFGDEEVKHAVAEECETLIGVPVVVDPGVVSEGAITQLTRQASHQPHQLEHVRSDAMLRLEKH